MPKSSDPKVHTLPVHKKEPDELLDPDLAEWQRIYDALAARKKLEFDAYVNAGFTPEQAIDLIK